MAPTKISTEMLQSQMQMTYSAKKINHANKEHIGASYRAAYRKFATEILKEVQLKDLYSPEINLKGKVRDTNHIYRILPLPPGTRNGPASTPNGEFPGGHSRTPGTYGAKRSRSKLPDDEDSDLDSKDCQAGQSNQGLEPNLWYMLPGTIPETARPQL